MDRIYLRWLIGIGTAIVVLLVALVVVVATGDGTDEAAGTTETTATTLLPTTVTTAPGTTVTTAPPTTVTTAPPTTVTTAPPTTTTTLPPPPTPSCTDAGPIPGGATDVSTMAGDYDGDGSADEFSAYRLAGSWFLWAHLSDGDYRLVSPLDAAWSGTYWDGTTPTNVAVLDASLLGDPREVATVRLYAGLGQLYGLFAVESCGIVPMTDAAGAIPGLYSAMGPSHSEFPACMEPDSIVQQIELSCPGGSDMASCAAIDAVVTPYVATRDPAHLYLDGGGSWTVTIDQAQYQVFLGFSCLG
ncbi:MAG: hypothetical protein KQH83_01185 [Actinobacteria bacterium]|nr:hypothetical protein [Actinomycetota bacterium]